MSDKKPLLPKYCYARGNRIWIRVKDEKGQWVNKRTDFTVDQVDRAKSLVADVLRQVEANRRASDQGVNSLQDYGRRWCDDRDQRGVASSAEDRARLEKYVFPHVGDVPIPDLRPRHARDMVRALRALKRDDGAALLAPRTIINIYRLLHCVMEGAFVDELVVANPIKVKRGELPNKVDADVVWRSKATYAVEEVRRLVTDPLIPVERRVTYALKALSGMRHGEVAALAWDQIDWTAEPLAKINVVRAHNSRTREIKRTKTEVTHAVPMHPALARILAEWRDVHWVRVYGRMPTASDLVVPTRNHTPVAVKDINDAMKRDMAVLGMRVDAGTRRDRGGHDLRSWFQTQTIEDGADSLLVRRITHAPPKDVNSGYERFSWQALCREIAKLKFELAGPDQADGPTPPPPPCAHCGGTGRAHPPALPLATLSLQAEKKAGARWTSVVTPSGLEPGAQGDSLATSASSSTENGRTRQHEAAEAVATRVTRETTRKSSSRKTALMRIAAEIQIAIDAFELPRAKGLLKRLRDLEDARVSGGSVTESMSESTGRGSL